MLGSLFSVQEGCLLDSGNWKRTTQNFPGFAGLIFFHVTKLETSELDQKMVPQKIDSLKLTAKAPENRPPQ